MGGDFTPLPPTSKRIPKKPNQVRINTIRINSSKISYFSDLAKRTALIISNEEMNYTIKTVKSVEEPGILIKDVSETIKNETKDQKGGFIGMLLGTLGASLLGNLLTVKGIIRSGGGTIRAGKGTIRGAQNFSCCLIL